MVFAAGHTRRRPVQERPDAGRSREHEAVEDDRDERPARNQLRVAKQLKPLRFRAEQASCAASCSWKPEKRAR